MKLQTKVPVPQSPAPIGYDSRVILLGSCFSANIGDKLAYYKFRTTQNPFGILYHPLAIEKLIRRAIHKEEYTSDEVFFHNERWHCYDSHSQMSSTNRGELVNNLNQGLLSLGKSLEICTHLIITLGSAWVYNLKSSGTPVANCHKVPQTEFERKLTGVGVVEEILTKIIRHVEGKNPHLHCIFTISPVRHLRDGFIQNLRSKAHLISAVQQLVEGQRANMATSYFPSYEIMMDELRDYRFYAADLVHPNALGIQYIWEIFKEANIATAAYPLMDMVESIQKGLEHRPFNPGSKAQSEFRRSREEKMDYLKRQYEFITFES
jgi:hypothetical protein